MDQPSIQSLFPSNLPESSLIHTLLAAIKEISKSLEHSPVVQLESKNKFGDLQLHQDIHTDQIVEKHLRENPTIRGFASEERPEFQKIEREGEESSNQNEGYIVTYDPLDGSSVIDTNFSVGSIFSIWPYTKEGLIGTKIGEEINAILAVYGPRTTVIIFNKTESKVQEITLIDNDWVLTHDNLRIKEKTNMFVPGNLRSTTENEKYKEIVHGWMEKGWTLRYTGGLVPDIAQIFIKGHGIFANIASKSHKSKLRVLYEVAAVAFLIEKAGGLTVTDGKISVLDVKIKTYDDRMEFDINLGNLALEVDERLMWEKNYFDDLRNLLNLLNFDNNLDIFELV